MCSRSATRGKHHSKGRHSRNNPTTLGDVYFRVGGPHIGKVDVAMQVNSDKVLLVVARRPWRRGL